MDTDGSDAVRATRSSPRAPECAPVNSALNRPAAATIGEKMDPRSPFLLENEFDDPAPPLHAIARDFWPTDNTHAEDDTVIPFPAFTLLQGDAKGPAAGRLEFDPDLDPLGGDAA